MHVARLGRIVGSTASSAMAFAAVFAAVLLATPSARAHGGVSIGIGFGFPAFAGVPIYSPPVYYVPPPVYYSSPYVGYYGPPPLHRRHFTGYAIIVIAAVAIDPAMDQPCPSHFISGYESRFSADPTTTLARLLETS